MTHMDNGRGRTGAKRQSWSPSHEGGGARYIVSELVRENPGTTPEEITELVLDRTPSAMTGRNRLYLWPFVLASVTNIIHAMERESRRTTSLYERSSPTTTMESALGEAVRRVTMLDLVMPNDKKLRDCTGKECMSFGGWYRRIGKATGVKNLVGDKLTEDQIWALKELTPTPRPSTGKRGMM